MDELAADTHPGRPDGAEIKVAPHGTRGAGPTDLVEANNEEDGFMDDESGGGDETRGNRSNLKSKARCLWRPEHDKMAVDAIRAAKAHVAPHGKNTKRFEQAADIFNEHRQAVDFPINSKALSDRWSTLKKAFAVKNAADESATGTEPSWTPTEMVLIDAVPEAQAHADLEKASRDEVTKKEERLVAQGEAIRKMAMERRGGLMRGPVAAPGGSTAGPNPSADGSSSTWLRQAGPPATASALSSTTRTMLWGSWSGARSGRPRRPSGKCNSPSVAWTMSAICTRTRPHAGIVLKRHSGKRVRRNRSSW